MEMEVRAVVHDIAAFQSDGGAVVPAWFYPLACTHTTVPKEHWSPRDAQARKEPKSEIQGVRGIRGPHIPLQNPIQVPSALKGNFAIVLTKTVKPDRM